MGERDVNRETGERAVYIISVAAELAGVHPQTLRIYERKGLVHPQRTSGNTRRYSQRDIERLRAIQALTDEGVNLAGVKRIIDLEEEVDVLHQQVAELRAQLERRGRSRCRDGGSAPTSCRCGASWVCPGRTPPYERRASATAPGLRRRPARPHADRRGGHHGEPITRTTGGRDARCARGARGALGHAPSGRAAPGDRGRTAGWWARSRPDLRRTACPPASTSSGSGCSQRPIADAGSDVVRSPS